MNYFQAYASFKCFLIAASIAENKTRNQSGISLSLSKQRDINPILIILDYSDGGSTGPIPDGLFQSQGGDKTLAFSNKTGQRMGVPATVLALRALRFYTYGNALYRCL